MTHYHLVYRQSKLLRSAKWSVAMVFVLGTLAVLWPTHRALASTTPKVLLALGDSLAAGYEPSFGTSLPPINPSSGYRDHGYPGSYAADLAGARGLRLVDLGCPGETTASMLGIPAQRQCARLYSTEFAAQSQLVAAETFLSHHRGQVALMTIDIGVNNLLHCVSASQVNPTCLQEINVSTQRNLAGILRSIIASLRRADPRARVIAMNYYDPFLGLVYSPGGTQGVKLALASLVATNVFNTELANTYRTFAVAVANTASAFQMNSPFPLAHYGGKTLPIDVVSTCSLTWMCPVQSQRSRDIHPNLTGYRTIARAFGQRLGS